LAKHVIIHLSAIGEQHVRWALADDKGALVSAVEDGTLASVAEQVEGRRVTLILPGNDVLLAEAAVPGATAARAAQAIPYTLEDQLADDVDSLHFALGSKQQDDIYPVAVIGRETMEQVTTDCEAAGLRPTEIVPEPLALPTLDAADDNITSWTALLDDDHTVVRLNGYRGFATDTMMANLMLDGARSDLPEDNSAALTVFHTGESVSLLPPDGVQLQAQPCGSRLALYANGIATAPHINLLQGEYSPKKHFDKAWKPWRWTAGLVALLGVVWFGSQWMDLRQLRAEESAIDVETARVFKEALPNSRMVRPRAQIQATLNSLGSGSNDGFTNRMNQIAASLATQPQTKLRSISYRNGRFDLDLTTDALPTLDSLKAEIAKRGSLSMTVQSANRDKEGLRGRVRIE